MRAWATMVLVGLAGCGGGDPADEAGPTLAVSARVDGEIEPCG